MREAGASAMSGEHGPSRHGDGHGSSAEIDAARTIFGYELQVAIEQGLKQYTTWARGELERR